MFIIRFLRGLFSSKGHVSTRSPVAKRLREAIGPLSGGSAAGGRMTGSAVYRHLERNSATPTADEKVRRDD